MAESTEAFSPRNNRFSIHSILFNNEAIEKTKASPTRRLSINEKELANQSDPHGPVRVTLENRALWDVFYKVGTEMVITKSGRRMFPAIKVTVQGLNPSLDYVIMLDVIPADNYRYKYHESEWLVTGKAYPDVSRSKRLYVHPESPSSGAKWMATVISFHKLKITNNTGDASGHVVLNSLHKYQPRVLIAQSKTIDSINEEDCMVFIFPETSFMAVTAYQSEQITQLKIDNNPFAKGFRDPSPCDLERARMLGSNPFGLIGGYAPEMYPGAVNTDAMRHSPGRCARPPYYHQIPQGEWHPHLPRELRRGEAPVARITPEGIQVPLHTRLHKQLSYPPCGSNEFSSCGSSMCVSCCHSYSSDSKPLHSSPLEHGFCKPRCHQQCHPFLDKDHFNRLTKHGCKCMDTAPHEQTAHKRLKLFDGTVNHKTHHGPCECQRHRGLDRMDWSIVGMRGRFPTLS